jgi:hypothetical protein
MKDAFSRAREVKPSNIVHHGDRWKREGAKPTPFAMPR